MGNQDTIRNMAVAGAVFFAILYFMPRLLPPPPTRPGAQPEQQTASGLPATSTPQTSNDSGPGASDPGRGFTVVQADSVEQRILGSAEFDPEASDEPSPYRMRLTLSNEGASIDTATMSDHAEALESDDRYTLLRPVELANGTVQRSMSIEQITVDGVILPLRDALWQAGPVTQSAEGEFVEFTSEIHQDDTPALRLTRRFHLPKQAPELHRHDLESTLQIENVSAVTHKVIVRSRGGVGIQETPGARFMGRAVDAGIFDGQPGGRVEALREQTSKVAKKPTEDFPIFEPRPEAPGERLSWAAVNNTYFTCTLAPQSADGKDCPDYLTHVAAVDLDGFDTTDDDITLRFVTRETPVDPGEVVVFGTDIYLGEKDLDGFRDVAAYADRNYYSQISQGFGFCTFTWLVELMIRLLNGLCFVVRDYGVAIIILVVVVRVLLHPITKKGQVNMVKMQQKMQELQPKIEEIKKKYANDKARMNQEMMKLNINPAGQMLTCLPQMIQLPIWVALFLSLSNNIRMRHEPFLFTWINDLTAPDALYTFSSPIHVPIFGWELPAFNLLPILVAIFMYTQQKLQPKPAPSANMSDQQKQTQDMMKKMMPMMSIMMLLFFYKMPSGLNLYIMASSLFGTIEQHYIRKFIKRQEATGTLHKPSRDDKGSGPSGGPASGGPRKPSFFEKLQKMADEAQKLKQQSKPPKRKVKR